MDEDHDYADLVFDADLSVKNECMSLVCNQGPKFEEKDNNDAVIIDILVNLDCLVSVFIIQNPISINFINPSCSRCQHHYGSTIFFHNEFWLLHSKLFEAFGSHYCIRSRWSFNG